jgi:hypothetical protein
VPVEVSGTEGSDIVDATFAEVMADLLTLHHSLHEAPLSKKPFEYLIKQCLTAQGHHAELNPNPGGASYDVEGGGTRWSLKTEAAKGITPKITRIEKFMEARWIRECTSPAACAKEFRTRATAHIGDYGRILVLRAFAREGCVVYNLEEIPKEILIECFGSASTDQFVKQRKALSFGANFHLSRNGASSKAFRVLLDSSVEKIRLWYSTERCVHHGTWVVRVGDTQSRQQLTLG